MTTTPTPAPSPAGSAGSRSTSATDAEDADHLITPEERYRIAVAIQVVIKQRPSGPVYRMKARSKAQRCPWEQCDYRCRSESVA